MSENKLQWHYSFCVLGEEEILKYHGSHFFGLTNFPDFSSFFCIFQYFFINFSSIFCIFPVFFHQLFQYFPHFSSVFFIGFSKCSQTRLICALLIPSFLLNSSGKFENFESIIIYANVKLPS